MKVGIVKKFFKKLFSFRFSKPIAVLLVLCIVATVVFGNKTVQKKLFGGKATTTQRTATVQKGNLQSTVSGSGAVYFTNDKVLYSKIGATVTKVNYKEGDTVKSGAVIAEFDDSDFQSTLSSDLLNLQQAQLAVQDDQTSVAGLTVTAPFAGEVTGVSLQQGDPVQSGSTICTISNTAQMQATFTFTVSDAAKIKAGQSASVYIAATMQTLSGTVASVASLPTVTSQGGVVYNVTVLAANPGAVAAGQKASADISTSSGTVSSTGTAALSYAQTEKILAQAGGTVQTVNISEGSQVSAGAVLCTLKSTNLTQALSSDEAKLSNVQSQYQQAQKQLENYTITAPFNGTITKLDYKVGDTVTAGSEIAEVADPSSVAFDIDVDELDIAKVAAGQSASVTLDAITSTTTTPLTGKVTKIAVTGTSSEGVTSYPVTVQIENGLSGIKGGMNANANIVVSSVSDALYVPVEAVTTVGTRSFVYVKSNGKGGSGSAAAHNWNASGSGGFSGNGYSGGSRPSGFSGSRPSGASGYSGYSGYSRRSGSGTGTSVSSSNYYAGAVMREVTLGITNGTYIQIKSGLTEGEVVVLPKLTTTAKTTSSTSSRSVLGGGTFGGGGGTYSGGSRMTGGGGGGF